ncbi:unnamed protein product [Caretta caretta]
MQNASMYRTFTGHLVSTLTVCILSRFGFGLLDGGRLMKEALTGQMLVSRDHLLLITGQTIPAFKHHTVKTFLSV